MRSLASTVIETQRLRLVPSSLHYAEAVFEAFTPEVTTYMFPAPPSHIEETRDFLQGAMQQNEAGTHLQVVILSAESGEFLGHGGLHHVDTRTPELGIWIKKAAHGHSYGLEAVTGLAGWALANLDFEYLVYPVDRRNFASSRIPETLGGVVAAEYEQTNASGNVLELLEYRIEPHALSVALGRVTGFDAGA